MEAFKLFAGGMFGLKCRVWRYVVSKVVSKLSSKVPPLIYTGILNKIRAKLRDWAVWQARARCYSQPALSSNDSKTLYLASCCIAQPWKQPNDATPCMAFLSRSLFMLYISYAMSHITVH